MGSTADSISKWIFRLTVALLIWPGIGILFFRKQGWETGLPGLSDRETTIARTGVLFEHATQFFLWILVLVVNESSSPKLRQFAMLTTVLWLAYAGVWGLQAFFVGCESYGLCLEDAQSFQVMSGGLMVAVMLAMSLSYCSTDVSSGYQQIGDGTTNHDVSVDEERNSDVASLNEKLRKAASDSKDKDKLIAKLGKKLKSLLAENDELRTK